MKFIICSKVFLDEATDRPDHVHLCWRQNPPSSALGTRLSSLLLLTHQPSTIMPSSKKNKPKKVPQRDRDAYRATADAGHETLRNLTTDSSEAQLEADAQRLLGQLSGPASSAKATTAVIEKLAKLAGTNVEMNENDPFGNGDQREVGERTMAGEPTRQILRNIFSRGGDLEHYLIFKAFTPFMMACAIGNLKTVERLVRATAEGEERIQLLERRETGMRMSPLLVTLAFSRQRVQ